MCKSAHAADDDDAGTKIQASLVAVEEEEDDDDDRPPDRHRRHLFSRFYAALARSFAPSLPPSRVCRVRVVQGGNSSGWVKPR